MSARLSAVASVLTLLRCLENEAPRWLEPIEACITNEDKSMATKKPSTTQIVDEVLASGTPSGSSVEARRTYHDWYVRLLDDGILPLVSPLERAQFLRFWLDDAIRDLDDPNLDDSRREVLSGRVDRVFREMFVAFNGGNAKETKAQKARSINASLEESWDLLHSLEEKNPDMRAHIELMTLRFACMRLQMAWPNLGVSVLEHRDAFIRAVRAVPEAPAKAGRPAKSAPRKKSRWDLANDLANLVGAGYENGEVFQKSLVEKPPIKDANAPRQGSKIIRVEGFGFPNNPSRRIRISGA